MKYIVLIISMLFATVDVFAQIPKAPEYMVSPNAASLGEYGEVPVSLFSGLPQIEIPLYDMQIGEYTLPISLSYHAGGVRPDQHPGWTGLGWTLRAGGCISREVRGLPDEFLFEEKLVADTILIKSGYYYRHQLLNFNWENKDYIKTRILDMVFVNDTAYVDTEPDKFSFNFLNYSGTFFMDADGEWRAQCSKPIKVIFNGDETEDFANPIMIKGTDAEGFRGGKARSHSFRKFTIIGEDGTKYIFGDAAESIEYSVGIFNQFSGQFMANTWNLSKIIYPNGERVEFLYSRSSFLMQGGFSVNCTTYKTPDGDAEYSTPLETNVAFDGSLVYPSYLKTISSSTCHINFEKEESTSLKYNCTHLFSYRDDAYNSNDTLSFMPILIKNGTYDGQRNYPNCINGLKWYKLASMNIYKYSKK